MGSGRNLTRPLLVAVLAFAGLTVLIGSTGAGFSSSTSNTGNRVDAASDFRAPTVSTTVISKTPGYVAGFVKQGGTYRVYANVTDTGNPASGISSVSANVSNITTGQTAVTMSSGSFSAQGVSYNYRSGSLTANSSLSAGSKSYTLATADNASNNGTANSSVTVDNTAPFASDIQTANTSGGTVGKPEAGDTVTFTYSEPTDPESILSGWTGGSTSVVVRIPHGLLALGHDGLEVWNAGNSSQLPLGSVDLGRNDYVNGALGGRLEFGATGSASTMSMSGNSITVTFGTLSTVGLLVSASTAGGTGTMSWTPSATAYDRAGNNASTTAANESGGADKEF